ncbi:TetR/AcrR family transcriptional regulator [Leucobacter luti]|uniref:TetR/AcrR family transcriptional regulator n=1 Tax=Leucobacter luti TaxID=340320 RepID=UPI003D02F36C
MNRVGRPREAGIDARIVDAVAELVPQYGYSGLTVERVVKVAKTSKPAFYRRFKSIADVVPLILASRFGTDVDVDTGSVAGDLLEIQIRQCELYNHVLTRSALAGFLDYLAIHPDDAKPFVEGYLAPRRAFTHVLLDRGVARGEIPAGADPAYVADLLTGPVIMRGLLPGMPAIDAELVRRTVSTVLTEIGYTGDRSMLEDFEFPREA